MRYRQREYKKTFIDQWQILLLKGSVLNPVLFIIFTNYMPVVCSSLFKLYADDSKLVRSVMRVEDSMEMQELCRLAFWSKQQGIDNQLVELTLDKTTKERDLEIISLVCPHVELSGADWNTYRRSDIEVLEKVQRRFPKMRLIPYVERREALGWSTIEKTPRRGDLIQLHKIQHGHDRETFIR
ncbi:RNA-directed DNA polymerase from mobile element jockey-like [Brachionus plicatilis]|uniref:RNA-directed DNA polymerase from mobile element jockey-like n=1 Tax=Brachionus plicatilis TaxID=10195 RepID=A0A3M7Q9C0_BRAPC|nr:RNA-directed DNA polymerase from mobile element jockey-like [Brachionus plicatilis]